MQIRSMNTQFRAAEDENEPAIEGYFVVFDQETELYKGVFESVDRNAFNKTLNDDIRALTNHDTTLVLGRNRAGTLELTADERGLFGKIKINQNDMDAMNIYQRVKRGDVSQCSFGFDIVKESEEYRDDGTVHFRLEEVNLREVSVCTFPAYPTTGVNARAAQIEEHKKRALEAWKIKQREEIKKWH